MPFGPPGRKGQNRVQTIQRLDGTLQSRHRTQRPGSVV
jgi:hypothetical protein